MYLLIMSMNKVTFVKKLKSCLRKLVTLVMESPLHKAAKWAYDVFLMAEYYVLSAGWFLKGGRRPDREQAAKVAKNVTFIYKSFERQYMAKRLFASIQRYYPGARVIIADDSRIPLRIDSKYAKVIHLPFNSGLSFGLSPALAEVDTP